MNGRRIAFLAIALALPAILTPLGAAAQDWSSYEVTVEPLGDDLFHLSGAGSHHVACADEQGLLLIDAGYEEMAGKLQEALAGLERGPVRLLVDTHWHFDHVGGNAAFAAEGAALAAHETVRRHMQADQVIAVLDAEVPASPATALPGLTFTDGMTLYWGDEEVRLIHMPDAHTDGDLVVHFVTSDVIQTGDVVFCCGYPFIDVNHGGTIDGAIAAVERIIGLCGEETRVIPGHGRPGGRADLEEYLAMLRDYRAAIAAARAAGRSLESIQEDSPTPEMDERYGRSFFPAAAFAEMVYRTLPEN